jgi:hypothetical protein
VRWSDPAWLEFNQRSLMAEIDRLRRRIEDRLGLDSEPSEPVLPDIEEVRVESSSEPPSWKIMQEMFGLSTFERDILLLCAGIELSSQLRERCERLAGPQASPLSFGLALGVLDDPHWTALAPDRPLRRLRLVELDAGRGPTTAALRIDEAILHTLAGHHALDERLRDLIRPVVPNAPLFSSHEAQVGPIMRALDGSARALVHGCDVLARQHVAARALAELGLYPHRLRSSDIPLGPHERAQLATLWTREAAMMPAGLILDVVDHESAERKDAVAAFLLVVHGAVVVTHREPLRWPELPIALLELPRPSADEQRATWRQLLSDTAIAEREMDDILSEFRVGLDQMLVAVSTMAALLDSEKSPTGELPAKRPGRGPIWQVLRHSSRGRLDALAQRIESDVSWEDLVVPPATLELLRTLTLQARHRATVYETWGFAGRNRRGLGLSALFSGPSGVGKTLAAEVIANELELDLYKIDLSQMVSKYIGETEKNLARVFDVAEGGGIVLLFDEADALFGQRSEVKDSHDRYANIEVSYLLQRMEAFHGIAILTTNQKSALDSAFLRRLRFVVPFPHPDPSHRAILWRKAFPAASHTAGLDVERLARLNLTGGNIRSVALNAAFLAAEAREPVGMHHVIQAARAEYQKLERPFAATEFGGFS